MKRSVSSWIAFIVLYCGLSGQTIVKYDLPCIVTPCRSSVSNDNFAILFSGDGGWFKFEQAISRHLAESGIPVIGIDTKKYFWNRKAPEKTASNLTRLVQFYMKEWNKSKFLLIGYSQGAEILPFLVTRIPEDIKTKLNSVVMLSPGLSTDFEIHMSNMAGIGNKNNTYDVVSEIMKAGDIFQLIIFGDGEKTTIPQKVRGKRIEIVRIPGDHHFKGNSALIVQVMKDKKVF
jgi:type IV secretory pathway VirJ component